jgi:predicted dehydrogenase
MCEKPMSLTAADCDEMLKAEDSDNSLGNDIANLMSPF